MPVATWGREHDPRGTLLAPCDGSPCNTAYGDQRQLGHRGRGGLGTFNKLLHGNKNRRPPLQSLLSCPPPKPACLPAGVCCHPRLPHRGPACADGPPLSHNHPGACSGGGGAGQLTRAAGGWVGGWVQGREMCAVLRYAVLCCNGIRPHTPFSWFRKKTV